MSKSSVSFEALIKKFTIISLVSLDKEAELLLRFNAIDTELLNQINKLHSAEAMVKVTIEGTDG